MTFNSANWDNSYSLTIDSSKVTEDLTDFPVSIVLSSGTGQTGFDVSDIFDELTVSGSSYVNRKKIAVTTTVSGAETELYTEIANWDHNNEEASLWTKVPTIVSGTDTELMLYYDTTQSGNIDYVGDTGDTPAQEVWSNNFISVWHMEQDPTCTSYCVLDSTSNEHHGDPNSNMTTDDSVSGKIANALDFDGNDSMSLANSTDFEFGTDDFTIEHVVCPEGTGSVFSNYESTNRLHTPYFDSATASRILVNGATCVNGVVTTASVYQHFVTVRSGADLKVYVNNVKTGTTGSVSGVSIGGDVTNVIGASGGGHGFHGKIDELRISSVARSIAWNELTYYSNWDDLITFSPGTFFTFFNPFPSDSSTTYGVSKDLKINVTVTGTGTYSTYDAHFYNGLDDSQISSTVSGVTNSAQSSVSMSTPSGIEYNWYVKATSSGSESISNTYTFDNRFLCHGWVEDQGARASGIPVRLYRRSTGELIGTATTTGTDGTFNIESEFNEYHYSTALYDSTDTNALIYDWIKPE